MIHVKQFFTKQICTTRPCVTDYCPCSPPLCRWHSHNPRHLMCQPQPTGARRTSLELNAPGRLSGEQAFGRGVQSKGAESDSSPNSWDAPAAGGHSSDASRAETKGHVAGTFGTMLCLMSAKQPQHQELRMCMCPDTI